MERILGHLRKRLAALDERTECPMTRRRCGWDENGMKNIWGITHEKLFSIWKLIISFLPNKPAILFIRPWTELENVRGTFFTYFFDLETCFLLTKGPPESPCVLWQKWRKRKQEKEIFQRKHREGDYHEDEGTCLTCIKATRLLEKNLINWKVEQN